MNTGRIKWFNAFQSYGYIVLWDGTEVYFHSTGVRNNGVLPLLNPGADVTFDLIQTNTGPEAHNVEPLA
ncbi:MAG: cold-shock protein [Bdellovibrionales bacterium]